jgi:acylphosphatase
LRSAPLNQGSTAPERWRLIAHGRVQGVGYRAGCRRRAIELGLGGWVRNREDGSVELEAEGLPGRLAELRLWCEQGPPAARVIGVTTVRIATTGADWFEIRR